MKNKLKIKIIFMVLLFIILICLNTFSAIVSDNDGSAFVTKAEFDALKNSFNKQIDNYNSSIDGKIDGAIASYLSGLQISKTDTISLLCSSLSSDGYIYSVKHADLGFQAGYPDLQLSYGLSASTKNYGGGGVGLAMRSHAVYQAYSSPDDASHAGEFSKRLYLTSSGSDYYYDALYKVKDTINIKNYITKTNVDVGFDHQGAAYKLSVLTSHNSNDTNLSLNTWASNLYWTIGGLTNTYSTAEYMRLYQNTKYSIGVTTEKKSKVYGAIILNETASSDTYPYWDSDDSKLSTNWRQLSSTTQNTAHNNLYYVTIETMWPKLSFSKSVSSYGVSYGGGYHTGTHSLSAGAVGSYDNQCERKNYTNKCWPLRMYNGLIDLENVYQGDKKAYSYKNESGASVYLDKYKLNGGVPFAATEVDWQFRWKPKFVNNTTLATTTCTPEFSYGPFNDSSSTVVTDVTYNAASGEYSFKTPKNGLIFVRWPNGVALDVASSQNITVIRPE